MSGAAAGGEAEGEAHLRAGDKVGDLDRRLIAQKQTLQGWQPDPSSVDHLSFSDVT